MSSTRQDAWTQDEDLLLAEVVLRHIKEGSTQLTAFEEVGKQLSRTAAACGFRWNSYVRKQYKSGIEHAKKLRKELKKNRAVYVEPEQTEEEVSIVQSAEDSVHCGDLDFDRVVQYLKALYVKAENAADKQSYELRIQGLEKQLYAVAAENEKLAKELSAMEEDHKALIEIMERARQMVGQKEERGTKVNI